MVVLSEDLAKPIVGTAKVGLADDAGAGAVSACSRLQDRRIADLSPSSRSSRTASASATARLACSSLARL